MVPVSSSGPTFKLYIDYIVCRRGSRVGLMLGTNLRDPIDPILFVHVMRKVAAAAQRCVDRGRLTRWPVADRNDETLTCSAP